MNVAEIVGRTIHPDGTVVPFTGKPYLKTLVKANMDHGTAKLQTVVFTLPDVTVGSIIEYRYASRINEGFYEVPQWIIQRDLYVKSAHYAWNSAGSRHIAWLPILPPSAHIEQHESGGSISGFHLKIELSISDVPPQIEEEYSPPIANYGYRVLFYFTGPSPDDFWKDAGKDWFHESDAFLNPNSDLTAATQQIVAGATTEDEKLRKIYAAVEQLENTDYTREHERREDKANGLAKLNRSSDILRNRRGNSTELTQLFVGMARAIGIKADLMLVPDRSRGFFIPGWLTLGQFPDVIAIANVGGKDLFFDPGSRYCPFGKLAWTAPEGQRCCLRQNSARYHHRQPGGTRSKPHDRLDRPDLRYRRSRLHRLIRAALARAGFDRRRREPQARPPFHPRGDDSQISRDQRRHNLRARRLRATAEDHIQGQRHNRKLDRKAAHRARRPVPRRLSRQLSS
jgi:hypothetical protein